MYNNKLRQCLIHDYLQFWMGFEHSLLLFVNFYLHKNAFCRIKKFKDIGTRTLAAKLGIAWLYQKNWAVGYRTLPASG